MAHSTLTRGALATRQAAITAACLVGAALAALAACGGNGGEAAVGETEPGTVTAAETVVQVESRPQQTTPLAEVQEASIPLPGEPDWMTFHGAFVWVKRADGIVTRIDPATSRPNGEVRADTKSDRFCEGIGAGGGAVWSCSGSDVVRIDPEGLNVTHSIPVAKIFDQGRLVFADGKFWVLSGEGDRLVGIHTATASIGPTVELPVPCSELGPGPDLVWVFCSRAGKVLAVDPSSTSIEVQLELDEPFVGFATERDLWVGSAGSLVRVDLETLEPVARFADLDPGIDGTVVVDGENVWVRTAGGFLHRIDALSNTVAERIEPEDALSGGDVLVEAGSLWATAYNEGLVLRVRPGAG